MVLFFDSLFSKIQRKVYLVSRLMTQKLITVSKNHNTYRLLPKNAILNFSRSRNPQYQSKVPGHLRRNKRTIIFFFVHANHRTKSKLFLEAAYRIAKQQKYLALKSFDTIAFCLIKLHAFLPLDCTVSALLTGALLLQVRFNQKNFGIFKGYSNIQKFLILSHSPQFISLIFYQ